MISIGGSSTYLQNQIISGFDSVAQGFTATAPTASSTSLQTALDSFSSFGTNETTALASMTSQQQISGAAEFSSPATYLQTQFAPDDEILRAFQDPSLASGGDLSAISEILSKITADAEQKGIIIVSGSPTQLLQRASTKLEQAGLMTPPQVGGSTELDQVGLMTPPQVGGSTIPTEPHTPSQFGAFDTLQSQVSNRLEQAGLMTPPQIGGSTKLEQAGLMTPPQVGGSQLEKAGLMTPPQYPSDPHFPTEPHAPSQFGAFDEITFSPQQTTTLASMSKTVREAASLYQATNLSMLSRRIIG